MLVADGQIVAAGEPSKFPSSSGRPPRSKAGIHSTLAGERLQPLPAGRAGPLRMKILVADDSLVVRRHLHALLSAWGHEPVEARDGEEAWRCLNVGTAPPIVVLDWVMPEPDGVEICHRIRETPALRKTYVLMLTGMSTPEHIVAGLNAGANDFIVKPFNEAELKARVNVGVRMVELQAELSNRVHELERAMAEITELRGILPICAYCKSVRDDQNYWQTVEQYIGAHADVQFSHGVCPKCMENVVKPELEKLERRMRERRPAM
jgi:phosphoserine phosphatase RsbU/P